MSQPKLSPETLQQHLSLCGEVLTAVEREAATLNGRAADNGDPSLEAKRELLGRLKWSLDSLRVLRMDWQRLSGSERDQQPEISRLVRQNQDLIMRIIVLDRENEQALLRRGMVPPRHLPAAPQRRPHFVAEMYRRQAGG